ncbi:hypothetical protein CC80DRAFT_446803 [Byssothecium circinans]|uniref:Uncharacterized protein n=1 Tax=Byssothecium circinans TaxID=147558 RepID=A0A6A5U402_9PLEO|nr:hypothetical protein CC80DRAFT_446803 [Byssothecium circinans]
MGDPLSVTGTVGSLVGLAIQLSQVSYQYVASVKGSSKAWSSYIQELSALTSVLLRLQAASEVQERGSVLTVLEPNVSKDAVNKCISDLQQLKAKLDGKLARRGVMGKLDALAWPFSEPDTQKNVDMLHRYHGLFSSALLADNFTVSFASYRELREQRQENELKQVLDWFRPRSGPQHAETIGEQRCPGTGSSFLGHGVYRNWRDKSENCLWAAGQPGVGKTVLSAAVLDDLKTSAPEGAVIVYHFFRANSSEDSLHELLRHFVFQGISQCSDIVLEAAEVRRRHTISNTDPLPKDLVHILAAISKASPVMYVVLDGLDECQYLSKLAQHLSALRLIGMKILITSRDLPDVRKYLEGYPQIDVRPERDDILRYVEWRLREDGEVEYDLLADGLKEDIASRLFEHVDGSFLLVRLLMDHIGGLTTVKKIRKFLEALPSDYEEAYQHTFDRIMKHKPGRRELALKVLNWVSNTKRPLTMRELQHAIAAEDNGAVVDYEDLESPKSILSSCVGLVRLSRTDQKVELIHSSAHTFIQKNQAKVDPDADMTICRACLAYLSNLDMASGPSTSLEDFIRRLRSLPFLEYAARFYGYHVRSVEQRCVPQLRQFLEDEKLREASWQVLHFAFSSHHVLAQDIFAGLPSHALILHVASYWGLSRLLTTILELSESLRAFALADIDAGDSHGWTPLHWAASMGQVDAAKLLLHHGAAVDSLDSAQWTPLFWAAIKGHHDIASLLLSHGANVHQVDSDGMTPLHWSVSAGQNATTHLLFGITEEVGVVKPLGQCNLKWLENREGLSISQAKRIAASYATSKSLVQMSAESLDSKNFSEFMQNAERKASQVNFYYRGGETEAPSVEPLFRTLWRVRKKGDWLLWLRRREKDSFATFRAKILERAIEGEHASCQDTGHRDSVSLDEEQ